MAKITTGQMFEQWEQMNQKLEALDNKIDGIIDGTTPANTQLTGSIVKVHKLLEGATIPANSAVNINVTFVGKSIGINGRWESGATNTSADITYNEYGLSTVRFISDRVDLDSGAIFIATVDKKRVDLTSPTVRLTLRNDSDNQVQVRYLYVTEYY